MPGSWPKWPVATRRTSIRTAAPAASPARRSPASAKRKSRREGFPLPPALFPQPLDSLPAGLSLDRLGQEGAVRLAGAPALDPRPLARGHRGGDAVQRLEIAPGVPLGLAVDGDAEAARQDQGLSIDRGDHARELGAPHRVLLATAAVASRIVGATAGLAATVVARRVVGAVPLGRDRRRRGRGHWCRGAGKVRNGRLGGAAAVRAAGGGKG